MIALFLTLISRNRREMGKPAPTLRGISSLPPRESGYVSQLRLNSADIFFSKERGFTLLEMVLVLFIMGLMANLSLMFIDNEDNQLRYQQTLRKLDRLRNASFHMVNFNDEFIFSGFIVDNGVSPVSIDSLINIPANWTQRRLYNASSPPKYRIDNSDAYSDLAAVNIYKGYRGRYVSEGLDSNGNYQTAWGQDFTVQTVLGTLQFGYDESLINDAEFNAVTNIRELPAEQSSIALSELGSLRLSNQTGSDISALNYKVAIAVFENSGTGDPEADAHWITYHAELTNVSIVDADSVLLTVTGWLDDAGNDANATRIPAGQHPVFIVLSTTHTTVLDQEVITVIPGYSPQPTISLVLTP